MIDINKPVKNPKLIKAINEFKRAPNQDSEQQFIKTLLEAHLLVPILKDKEVSNQLDKVELNKDFDLSVNEFKIPYDVKLDDSSLNRSEFENLTNEEIEKLAEYAEFLKSKRYKKSI